MAEIYISLGLLFVFVAAIISRRNKTPSRAKATPTRTSPKAQTTRVPTNHGKATNSNAKKDPNPSIENGYPYSMSGRAYIIDGDSLRIGGVEIRLFGVDAPELNHPYGQKAKWALLKLCKGHTIHADVLSEDEYGRCVAKCHLEDGTDVSAEMVRLGLALDWPKFSAGAYKALEVPGVRKKLWLADARQKGRLDVWKSFEAKQAAKKGRKVD